MNAPHKHADIIKAWADGSEIEVFNKNKGIWQRTSCPIWAEDFAYRVKPELTKQLYHDWMTGIGGMTKPALYDAFKAGWEAAHENLK